MNAKQILAVHAPAIACIVGAIVAVATGAHWGFFAVFLVLAFTLSVTIVSK